MPDQEPVLPAGMHEVTRAVCWLPPGSPAWARNENTDGRWSRIEKTWKLAGRIGYRVTTETITPAEDGRHTP